jgi:hypothetical protein
MQSENGSVNSAIPIQKAHSSSLNDSNKISVLKTDLNNSGSLELKMSGQPKMSAKSSASRKNSIVK